MSEDSVTKDLTALNGALVGQVYLTDYKHQAWQYDVLAGVPDGIEKLYGRRESLINGKRYVVIAENDGYESAALASEACMTRMAEIVNVLTQTR